jgi:hypothetical protein
MANYYTNIFKLDEDRREFFEAEKKRNLSTVEKIGLEAILADFVEEYEQEQFGETYGNIKNYIRYNADSVDILDGYTDTYIFDHYAIGSVWMTENGCIMMDAVDLDEYTGDDEEEQEEFDDADMMERPNKFDIWSDCAPVLFRLN